MASTLTLESKLKLPSGYEIPVLGYGASPRPPPPFLPFCTII